MRHHGVPSNEEDVLSSVGSAHAGCSNTCPPPKRGAKVWSQVRSHPGPLPVPTVEYTPLVSTVNLVFLAAPVTRQVARPLCLTAHEMSTCRAQMWSRRVSLGRRGRGPPRGRYSSSASCPSGGRAASTCAANSGLSGTMCCCVSEIAANRALPPVQCYVCCPARPRALYPAASPPASSS